jgi:hypothetical protein
VTFVNIFTDDFYFIMNKNLITQRRGKRTEVSRWTRLKNCWRNAVNGSSNLGDTLDAFS